MLLVMVGLVKLVNLSLGLLPAGPAGPLTFEGIVGWLLAPIAWLSGIPASESVLAGQLLGKKVVLNEFLAYLDLASLGADEISDRSRLILTYALCGFANFGSLGIMLAGLGTLVPERRGEIAQLGFKSILAGLLATCCTGAIIALITPGGG
jgi:CNT family concentrative nucleoside transporter